MGEFERARLKVGLNQHYASQRTAVDPETLDSLVQAMLTEEVRASGVSDEVLQGYTTASTTHPLRRGMTAFVTSQIRFIPLWTWAAQIALAAIMCALAYALEVPEVTRLAIGLLSAATVLVGVPTMQASKRHGVAELEYSCLNNTASILVARLIVLGCSSALVVGVMVAVTATSLDISVFDVALWACPPFFLSCAGSLAILRKANPHSSALLCVAWTLVCSMALLALASTVPDLYAHASLTFWAAAATAACVWLVREVALTVQAANVGLDTFSPHLANTHN